ncbi:putative N6-adenine methyltransferase-domain-containing protein [Hysterangium stoloniferum]|nr:putative N6-adenine methyltransferase-domain-containing protein [Hysterangium stoloniferum]
MGDAEAQLFQPNSRRSKESVSDEEDSSDDELLTLSASTLSALTDFLDEQTAAREALASLAARSSPSAEVSSEDADIDGAKPSSKPTALSAHKFKEIFKENWQLSQFWYSKDTTERLASGLIKVCPPNARVTFISCPTAYVVFQETALSSQHATLLEYDTRFAIFAGTNFIHYDFNEPLSFAGLDELRHSQDVLIVDPPYHNEDTQGKVALTVAHLLYPKGKLILLTGLSLQHKIAKIFDLPNIPKLKRRSFVIEHDGVGRLETPCVCWVGGGPEEHDEAAFGNVVY